MHEPLLERIRELERSVRRWRLVSLALMLGLLSFMAISCTLGLVLSFLPADHHGLGAMRMEAELERERAARAMMEAEVARQKAEADMQKARILQPEEADP
jgi:hypothetical protein